jgi:ABC-type oligopeptide transport system ATPase subunit
MKNRKRNINLNFSILNQIITINDISLITQYSNILSLIISKNNIKYYFIFLTQEAFHEMANELIILSIIPKAGNINKK